MPLNTPEILAPAGSPDGLTAAVRCGADAVYLGGRFLNARRGAANFDENGLLEAVSFCHARNVKVYLTLNTLVFDDEFDTLTKAVENACTSGVDAILTQDLATAAFIRATAPDMPLHASTQMSIHNLDGAKKLAEFGFSRVVLAREMSYNEIRAVTEHSGIEAEVFVHGALCMSVSGQCLLSSMLGGRSGNRGLCAQPCRLPFKSQDNDHALSLRDMSHIPHIPALKELGVASLKIEGRLKRPEYVAAAVTACRCALDGETPDMDVLEAVFSRGGFTDGYFTDKRGRDMFGVRGKEDVTAAAVVLKPLSSLYKDELQSVPIALSLTARQNAPVSLTVTDNCGNAVTVNGSPPEPARTTPLTKEKAKAMLTKTGGTPYTASQIEIELDEGIMLSSSSLNALRRDAVSQLHELRSMPRPVAFNEKSFAIPSAPDPKNIRKQQTFRARVGHRSQLSLALLREADAVIIPLSVWERSFKRFLRPYIKKIYVEIPHVIFEKDVEHTREILCDAKAHDITNAVAGNLGGIKIAEEMGFSVHGDYSLNVVNTLALNEYERMGLRDVTLSFETNAARIKKLGGDLPRGILAYGFLPLMTFRNCPSDCYACKFSDPQLTDRMGKTFPLYCSYGTSTLHNSVPLYLAEKLGSFKNVDFFTLYFTNENPYECLTLLRSYKNREPSSAPKTNGLYFRNVL